MNLFQAVIVVSLFGNTALGLFVLTSNPRRTVNVTFFGLTLLTLLWLGSMLMSTVQGDGGRLLFFVRLTSAIAAAIPVWILALHMTIIDPRLTPRGLFRRLRYWMLACVALMVICFSPIFARSSIFPTANQSVPVSQYGFGIILYLLFFSVVIVAMACGFWTARNASGVLKAESQFLQMGSWLSFSGGLLLFGASVMLDFQEISRFVPLAVLLLDGFVAYGIATRRILAASAVLQRVVAHALIAVYLVVVYVLALRLCVYLCRGLDAFADEIPHLLAALVVAFSVSPAHGWMQALSHRLFATVDFLNVNVLLEKAGQIFREVATEAHLTETFADLIADAFGTTKVIVLRPRMPGDLIQTHPEPRTGRPLSLPAGNDIVNLLTRDREAVTVDTLIRSRSTPETVAALKSLRESGAVLAVGGFIRNEMLAVLLLCSKKSGRIYDLRDQRTLQLLCDQFAVALENARLYTAVQDGKIYNDILLDSLTSGIVAVDAARRVTVFNRRAQGLTGLSETSVVGQPVTVLPVVLATALNVLLDSRIGFRNRDLRLLSGGEILSIRASGATFLSHVGGLLGALVVFDDLTLLKKMEEQLRRTDRLSSIGTLSAAMAHEIKNPLVTIKTFAQLLPEQHGDAEFRKTFFELVGQEAMRIDAIVNRLLNFSRPSPPVLKPIHLHAVLNNSLRLVETAMYQNAISLQRGLDAADDLIAADAEQLNQTFINLFLNAIQAMNRGGVLTVRTSLVPCTLDAPRSSGLPVGDGIQMPVCPSTFSADWIRVRAGETMPVSIAPMKIPSR